MIGLEILQRQMAQAQAPHAVLAPTVSSTAGGFRVRAESAYDAGAVAARRVAKWYAPTVSPNQALLASLATLRDRARHAVRNDGFADGAIDAIVRNLIGTGIKPLCQVQDTAFRADVHALWQRWTDESDADGLLDFYGQQALAARGWCEAGEMFIRLRPRRPEDVTTVPLQVQVLEPELCPHTYDRILPNGHRIRAGIEFDGIRRRVAYWFHPSRPEDPMEFDASQLRRVPAHRVIHLYQPLRAGQLRAAPLLTHALVKLHEIDKFDDAALLRQQIANLFVGFITRPTRDVSAPINPLTGEAITDATERPLAELNPGIFQELDPGDDVRFSDPPDVGSTYPDFMRQQLMAVAAATKVPYEVLTGDMSKVNDRTVRVILHEFRRRIQAWQHQVIAFQLCRRVYREWLDQAFLAGALALPASYVEDPAPWVAVKWMPQAWPYLHPVQDVQATREAIRSGLTSRSAEVSERGEDAEAIDQEQAADNKRSDALGLKYDSDGRHERGVVDAGDAVVGQGDGEVRDAQPAGAAA